MAVLLHSPQGSGGSLFGSMALLFTRDDGGAPVFARLSVLRSPYGFGRISQDRPRSLDDLFNSDLFRTCSQAYTGQLRRIWAHLPSSWHLRPLGQAYGRHIHDRVRSSADRTQYVATFFFRNRPELELIRRLASQNAVGSDLNISVLACSKGAEVYSLAWTLRSSRPDLRLKITAVDVCPEILEFAQKGTYSLQAVTGQDGIDIGEVESTTNRDQNAPIFERIHPREMRGMFDIDGDRAQVKPFLREGITWQCGDVRDPEIASLIGLQDIVTANRFLCHMEPAVADNCLRNIGRLVKPGGHLLVSGVDLDVRARVAKDLDWHPLPDLLKEIHEGDASLRRGWPVEYWGLEPFSERHPDWRMRYAAAFRVGGVN